MKYLRIFRAEFLREYTEAKRYPLELGMIAFFLVFIFFALYYFAQGLLQHVDIEGALAQFQKNTATLAAGYIAWTVLFMTIQSISIEVSSELRSGLLEQTFVTPTNPIIILCLRAAASTLIILVPVFLLVL